MIRGPVTPAVSARESFRSVDKKLPASQTFEDAYAVDYCVPDDYAKASPVEDFTHLAIWHPYDIKGILIKNYLDWDTDCMKSQLRVAKGYAGVWLIWRRVRVLNGDQMMRLLRRWSVRMWRLPRWRCCRLLFGSLGTPGSEGVHKFSYVSNWFHGTEAGNFEIGKWFTRFIDIRVYGLKFPLLALSELRFCSLLFRIEYVRPSNPLGNNLSNLCPLWPKPSQTIPYLIGPEFQWAHRGCSSSWKFYNYGRRQYASA